VKKLLLDILINLITRLFPFVLNNTKLRYLTQDTWEKTLNSLNSDNISEVRNGADDLEKIFLYASSFDKKQTCISHLIDRLSNEAKSSINRRHLQEVILNCLNKLKIRDNDLTNQSDFEFSFSHIEFYIEINFSTSLQNCKLTFTDCTFQSDIKLNSPNVKSLRIENCNFRKSFTICKLSNNANIHIEGDSVFEGEFKIIKPIDNTEDKTEKIEHFIIRGNSEKPLQFKKSFIISDFKVNIFKLEYCSFKLNQNNSEIYWSHCCFDVFEADKLDLDCSLQINILSIKQGMTLRSINSVKSIYIDRFSLAPDSNCNISQLLCDELFISASSWSGAGKIFIKNLLCKKLTGASELSKHKEPDGDQMRIEYSRNGNIEYSRNGNRVAKNRHN